MESHLETLSVEDKQSSIEVINAFLKGIGADIYVSNSTECVDSAAEFTSTLIDSLSEMKTEFSL